MKLDSYARRAALAAATASLLLSFGAQAGEDKMQMMDTNTDEMISAAEHIAGARQMFLRMDTDGDGRVTAAEMDAAQARMPGGTPAPAVTSDDKIRAIDADHDGVITASEHESGSRGMFTKMDVDGDGNLTVAEMQAGHQQLTGEQPR